jgi:hypothetical protein
MFEERYSAAVAPVVEMVSVDEPEPFATEFALNVQVGAGDPRLVTEQLRST